MSRSRPHPFSTVSVAPRRRKRIHVRASFFLALAGLALGCAGSSGSRPAALPAPLPDVVAAQPELPADLTSFGSVGAGDGERIGPEDVLDVQVFEAPEMNRTVRVAADGSITLALLGAVPAAGSTPHELEIAIQDRLREKYILDPHVTVAVKEVQSRPVYVLGAVHNPGVLQVRGRRTLLEVLAMAGGLAADAGETALVMHSSALSAGEEQPGGAAGTTQEINLDRLIDSRDAEGNVLIGPGDVIKVLRAGMVYVVGEVNQPGAFPLNGHGRLTVLQAIALSRGVSSTAAKGHTVIVRTNQAGERIEIPVDLGDVIAGRVPDPPLEAKDIVFVPNSSAKSVSFGLANALLRVVTLRAVF